MLESWLETPAIILAVVAVLTILWRAAHWKGAVDSDLPQLKSTMEEIRKDIKKIVQALPVPTAVSTSPMQLTEFGERIATSLGISEWAASEAETILDAKDLINLEPYQLEALCRDRIDTGSREKGVVLDHLDRAMYEFGVDMARALAVLRIPLRNALLRKQAALRQSG